MSNITGQIWTAMQRFRNFAGMILSTPAGWNISFLPKILTLRRFQKIIWDCHHIIDQNVSTERTYIETETQEKPCVLSFFFRATPFIRLSRVPWTKRAVTGEQVASSLQDVGCGAGRRLDLFREILSLTWVILPQWEHHQDPFNFEINHDKLIFPWQIPSWAFLNLGGGSSHGDPQEIQSYMGMSWFVWFFGNTPKNPVVDSKKYFHTETAYYSSYGGFLKRGDPPVAIGLNIKSWPSDLDDLGYSHDLGNLHLNTEGLLQYNQRDYCNNICSPLHVMMMNKSYNIYIYIYIQLLRD